MRVRLAVSAAVLLVCASVTDMQAQAATGLARTRMRNDVGIELLGKAAVYSFSYQRIVSSSMGLEVGVGALGGGGSGADALILFIPVSAKLYLIPKDGSLYITGGGVFLSAASSEGPFSDSAVDIYGHVGLGFEFRSQSGFLFRGTAYGLFGGGGWFVWPGLSIGYAF